MIIVRRILASVVLLLALAGLTVSGVEAATMMPDQSAAMAGDGMMGDVMTGGGMPDSDGCGGDAGSLASCAMVCGPSCAGDVGQVPGNATGKLVTVCGVIAPGSVLPPGVALSRDPPKPKPHSL